MTGPAAAPAPSRLHVLMRYGRTALVTMYLQMNPGMPPVARRAAGELWSKEQLATAIRNLEWEEADDDVAHDV